MGAKAERRMRMRREAVRLVGQMSPDFDIHEAREVLDFMRELIDMFLNNDGA